MSTTDFGFRILPVENLSLLEPCPQPPGLTYMVKAKNLESAWILLKMSPACPQKDLYCWAKLSLKQAQEIPTHLRIFIN